MIVANHQLHSDDTNGEHTHNSRFKWAPSDSVSATLPYLARDVTIFGCYYIRAMLLM